MKVIRRKIFKFHGYLRAVKLASRFRFPELFFPAPPL